MIAFAITITLSEDYLPVAINSFQLLTQTPKLGHARAARVTGASTATSKTERDGAARAVHGAGATLGSDGSPWTFGDAFRNAAHAGVADRAYHGPGVAPDAGAGEKHRPG